MSAGEIIYKAFMPTLKMGIGIGLGYTITKAGLFTPQMAKGVSILSLNISLPALIFASMVPSFTSTNISAFGGLGLAAIMYMVIGAALSWVVKEIFYVPLDFQWGIIVMGAISNWMNVPVAVIQTVGNQAPFNQGDVEVGIAYIGVFSLIFVVILFPCGLHKLCALDFKPERLALAEPATAGEKWRARIASIKGFIDRKRGRVPASPQSQYNQELSEVNQSQSDSERYSKDGEEKGEEPGDLRTPPAGKSAYLGGGAPTRQASHTPSFTSMMESTRPIPPTAPLDAVDVGNTATVPTSGKGDSILPTSNTPGKAYSYHKPASPKTSLKKPSAWQRTISILKSFLMPVSMAVVISIPCALIPPLRALFTRTDGWTGTRMPNAPDGKPPLAFILETAAFIGAICIPAGLILLGASFARLKGVWNFKGQPIGAIVAMSVCKMIILPVIGTFFIKNQTGIYPPADRMRTFVCILLSGTPAAVNQLVVTQLYNPEGSAHTLARFLLLQYILMPVLCTALAAVALYICQR